MSGHRRKKQTGTVSPNEYVTVAFAEDISLAKQYKNLLGKEGIPAAIKVPPDNSTEFPAIAVMVPEEYLDEAHILIESNSASAYDDFYDTAMGEEYIDTDEELSDEL